jgi:PKD repeat protein
VPYEKTLTDSPMWFEATANGATSWFWDFGDGQTSTTQNVQHAFGPKESISSL